MPHAGLWCDARRIASRGAVEATSITVKERKGKESGQRQRPCARVVSAPRSFPSSAAACLAYPRAVLTRVSSSLE